MIFSYARVSTSEQAADNATSLDDQQRRNKVVAQLRNIGEFDFVAYVDAGVSGSVPLGEREAGGRMLEDMRPGDIIVAAKLDRMFRSSLDALRMIEKFKERGVELILLDISIDPLDKSAAGELFFTMLAAFATFERRLIAERMESGKKAKTRKGGHNGGHAPFGYRIVGTKRDARLEPVVEEQEIIQAAKRAMASGSGVANATKTINEQGLRSRVGKPFQVTQVMRFVKFSEKLENASHAG